MNQETNDTPITKPSISEKINQTVRALTNYLNRYVNNKSTKIKKVGLLAFGVMTSGICFLLIVQSLKTTTKPPSQIHNEISLPKDLAPKGESHNKPMTEEEIIQKYNSYIDSLSLKGKN